MHDLVSIQSIEINGELVQTVNARELHAFLEVKTRFNDWISARIKEYGFVQDVDFCLTEETVGENQALTRKDYHVTLDMGKELAMVERNAKGREVRQYFIEVEKRYKAERANKTQLELLQEVVNQMVAQERHLIEQERRQKELEARQQKVEQRLDQIETAIDHFTIVGYAKKYLKRSITQAEASKYGRKATKLCKLMELETGEVPDPRFGAVKTYPKSVLDCIFAH